MKKFNFRPIGETPENQKEQREHFVKQTGTKQVGKEYIPFLGRYVKRKGETVKKPDFGIKSIGTPKKAVSGPTNIQQTIQPRSQQQQVQQVQQPKATGVVVTKGQQLPPRNLQNLIKLA